jgi:hypothetical protein
MQLLKRSKFTIISNENFYSMFCIDAMSCSVKIFFDKRIKPSEFFFNKDYYIPIDFEDSELAYDAIQNSIKNYKFHKIKPNNNFFDRIKSINNNIRKIMNSF